METKEILLDLRMKHSLSQDELAEKLFVAQGDGDKRPGDQF